ncbi:MAG: endonuclease/exonuclease/phosphatase family protein, partial [Bythopirellula sp.]
MYSTINVRLFLLLLFSHLASAVAFASTTSVARFATFNASLNRNNAGDLITELSAPGSAQPATIAEIIQRNNPDVVLINEFDYDAGGVAAASFQTNYLSVSQNGASTVNYPHVFVAPSNTGIPSGFDLNNDNFVGGPNDALGFGAFPGQFGMVLYSKYPIETPDVRTFQNFLWKDMPGALLPDDPDNVSPDNPDWYSAAELDVLPLSSKSHWDVPINVNGEVVHVLTSHPTPPVFDGNEDRNGRRNSDEIRFWSDYVTPGATSSYIYDDIETSAAPSGGLQAGDKFVVLGDLNSDPNDGDSRPGSVSQLLSNPLVNTTVTPTSLGGPEDAANEGNANSSHTGDPAFDTADFNPFNPGNLRVDYVLPSANMAIADAGVFWPDSNDPLSSLTGQFPFPGSDHRLVFADVVVPEPASLSIVGVSLVLALTR